MTSGVCGNELFNACMLYFLISKDKTINQGTYVCEIHRRVPARRGQYDIGGEDEDAYYWSRI